MKPERTSIGARQSVKEAEYYCHVFVRGDSLTGVCFSDHEYPPRVAHTLLARVLEDFSGNLLFKRLKKSSGIIYCA